MTLVRIQDGELARGYFARLGRVNDGTTDRQLSARLRRSVGLDDRDASKTLVELIGRANQMSVSDLVSRHSMVPFIFHTARSKAGYKCCAWSDRVLRLYGLMHSTRWGMLCETCVRSDLERGYSYWRRDHQLPGATTCGFHARPLMRVDDVEAFALLPTDALKGTGSVMQLKHSHNSRADHWVSRYLDFASHFMQQPTPTKESVYISAVGKRAVERGYCRDPRWPSRLISDDIVDVYPTDWLADILPRVSEKIQGAYFTPLDASIKASAKARTEAHCLALPLLFEDLQDFRAVCRDEDRLTGTESSFSDS